MWSCAQHIEQRRKRRLTPIAAAAHRRFQEAVWKKCEEAQVAWFGAIERAPGQLVFKVRTGPDAERFQLERDSELLAEFRSMLANLGYPRRAAARAALRFTSQEAEQPDYDPWYFGIPRPED